MLPILINILLAFHIVVSILIIFVVLMQRPKNEGLGAAFGGGMTENLFGAQTTNVLANFTRWLGGLFFFLTLTLSILYARETNRKSEIEKQLLSAPPVAKKAPVLDPLATAGATATPPVQVPGATPEQAEAADPAAAPVGEPSVPAPAGDATAAPAPESTAADPGAPAVPSAPSGSSTAPVETKDPVSPGPGAPPDAAPTPSNEAPASTAGPPSATTPAPTSAAPNP